MRELLQRCRDKGITLNPNKFNFAEENVKFVGYSVTSEGIEDDPEKISAIEKFPKPSNISELRSFLGLVNQLSEFSHEISTKVTPLRGLLSQKNQYQWLSCHDTAFEETEKALKSPPVLGHYDPKKEITLLTDASKLNGLGYAMIQKENGRSKLIKCGSRFLLPVESRYSTTELEFLAIVWAVNKCYIYLTGLENFTVVTDHRPLISILNKQTLEQISNQRIQRLKEKISRYNLETVWKQGKNHLIPDALSRRPTEKPNEDDLHSAETLCNYERNVVFNENDEKHNLDMKNIKIEAEKDEQYTELKNIILQGFPSDKRKISACILPFWNIREELSIEDEVVLYDNRIVIPKALQRDALKKLHASHQGIDRTKRRARQTVYWPGINSDIETTVAACQKCSLFKPSQTKETNQIDEKTMEWVFQDVAAVSFSTLERIS